MDVKKAKKKKLFKTNNESELRNQIFKMYRQDVGNGRIMMTTVTGSNRKTANFCKCTVLTSGVC